MHDNEPETFAYMTLPETFAQMLGQIGVESTACKIGTVSAESGDYYSRYSSSTPRMVTNRGCVKVSGKNIDLIHIVQKG